MIAGILLAVCVSIAVLLAWFTWVERVVARGAPWGLPAVALGFVFSGLSLATTLAFTFGW
jgi:hypothetical protein